MNNSVENNVRIKPIWVKIVYSCILFLIIAAIAILVIFSIRKKEKTMPVGGSSMEENAQLQSQILQGSQSVSSETVEYVLVDIPPVDFSCLSKRQVKLPLEFLAQNPELPAGCEITSLTTVLNYLGYAVSKTEMADNYLPCTSDVDNFYNIYVGNPYKDGFGCYAPAIVTAANKYLNENESPFSAEDISGSQFEELLSLVENGMPVIVWGTMEMEMPRKTVEWVVNGEKLRWIAPEHCLVLIGYDSERSVAIFSDPLVGITEYDINIAAQRYTALHSQAVVIKRKH